MSRAVAAAPLAGTAPQRRGLAGLLALAALGGAACRGEAPLRSCRDSLAGIWRVLDGDGGAPAPGAPPRRWALLDRGARVEGYPLFDDTDAASAPAADERVRSPRSLTLIRSHTSLVGHVERWVMGGARKCALRATARVFGCTTDVLAGIGEADVISVQLTSLAIPEDLATCVPAPAPAVPSLPVERWLRER